MVTSKSLGSLVQISKGYDIYWTSEQARSQDFLQGGAIQRGDGPNDVSGESLSRGGGGISCLRLHFERFDKLSTS